jgi:peptidoglycan/LPS O-acetylase OafA/YrhL
VKRVQPISSMRFFLAMWVFFGHLPSPVLVERQHNSILRALRALLETGFYGPAAVIAFFVISGFCIHFPNRLGFTVGSWSAYYTRRYVRILIPMAVAIGLGVPLRLNFSLFNRSILWSLLCEEIYYLVYPALLWLKARIGWARLLAASWAAGVLVIMTDPLAKIYPAYGPALNWVLGLSCWLLGARLAEHWDAVLRSVEISNTQIWAWRFGVWAVSVVIPILNFHTPIRVPWTLTAFAIIVVLWIEREITYYRRRKTTAFESLGEASYSLYLTHLHGATLVALLLPGLSAFACWWLKVLVTALLCAVFYCCVERPSHLLARRLAQRMTIGTGEIAEARGV